METQEVSRIPALPEELVERILALVPFPFIFKAQALSKSWLERFSPISSHDDDEEKKNLETPFQRRMALHWSTKWSTFCPVLIGKEVIMAYDRASRLWQRLPSLSFLPNNLQKSHLEIHGPLLFISISPHAYAPVVQYVANVLTRSWKRPPPRPWRNERRLGQFWGTQTVVSYTDTYKVFEFYEIQHPQGPLPCTNLRFQRRCLDEKDGRDTCRFVIGKGVHFNGAFYWSVGPSCEPRGLLAFNVEEETFRVLQLPALYLPKLVVSWDSFHLVVCDGCLLMLVRYWELKQREVKYSQGDCDEI